MPSSENPYAAVAGAIMCKERLRTQPPMVLHTHSMSCALSWHAATALCATDRQKLETAAVTSRKFSANSCAQLNQIRNFKE